MKIRNFIIISLLFIGIVLFGRIDILFFAHNKNISTFKLNFLS